MRIVLYGCDGVSDFSNDKLRIKAKYIYISISITITTQRIEMYPFPYPYSSPMALFPLIILRTRIGILSQQ